MPQKDSEPGAAVCQTHLVMETSLHIQHQCQGLANFLSLSDWSHCQTATAGAQMNQAKQLGRGNTLSTKLNQASS